MAAKEEELRPLESLGMVEKLLMAVVLIIGAVGLLYIFMTIHWIVTGNPAAQSPNPTFSNLLTALMLQGVLINAIFLWRILDRLTDISWKKK